MSAPFGRERRYVIRAYLVLAGGLMIAALVLDFAFSRLHSRADAEVDPWIAATFALAELRLAGTIPEQREAAVRALGSETGLGIEVLEATALSATAPASPQPVVAANGETFYLQASPLLDSVLKLGPIPQPQHGLLARFMPALFYLSILVIVGLWLRPLLADLRVLTTATQRFAADYREPLDTASRTTQLTSFARDLDEMSRRLSQLIQNQKALTAALSHEMRTPLARIRFALAVAGNDAESPVQAQLRDINADVMQIDALIASLLDYARLDHPDLRMEWQEVALGPWLHEVALAGAMPGREVEVVVHGGGAHVRLEPRLVRLAVSNLLANAARYARSRIRVEANVAGGTCSIAVDDDGPGIPADKRREVFRAYTRLEGTRGEGTGGFGLGLAIVARVAALHGGDARAGSSSMLGGARIEIAWPSAGAAPE
ncbi:MAG: ATP-binding protein [Pseudomonadota bacterium]